MKDEEETYSSIRREMSIIVPEHQHVGEQVFGEVLHYGIHYVYNLILNGIFVVHFSIGEHYQLLCRLGEKELIM